VGQKEAILHAQRQRIISLSTVPGVFVHTSAPTPTQRRASQLVADTACWTTRMSQGTERDHWHSQETPDEPGKNTYNLVNLLLSPLSPTVVMWVQL